MMAEDPVAALTSTLVYLAGICWSTSQNNRESWWQTKTS